ncbi:hypothetical protein P7C70_g290, partial [Phenoliferia sp. Uapishka_3]
MSAPDGATLPSATSPSIKTSIKRIISRKDSRADTFGAPLSRAVSHGVQQRPLSAEDDITYPDFTTAGPHTDAFQEETATGLVDAEEVESPLSRASSRTHVGADPELGEKVSQVKLVTWLENDPENPRNWSNTAKWSVLSVWRGPG